MAIIVEKAKEFERNLKEQHRNVSFFRTEYLTIGIDGVLRISPYTDFLKEANIGIIFCIYNYQVITAYDDSCFVQFVDSSGYCEDHYIMKGWIIGFSKPFTSSNRTYGWRDCKISNGEIGIEVRLPVYGIAEKVKLLWPYFLMAQECRTQKELNLLKDCYEKDIEIDKLTSDNLWSEHERLAKEEQLKAYRAVLDKIEELVNNSKI